MLLLVADALAYPLALRRASPLLRCRGARCSAAELQASLLSEVAGVPKRGAEAGDSVRSEVLALINEIEPLDPSADAWEDADALTSGGWRLGYTTSATFHDNNGLTGYYGPTESSPDLELLLRFTSANGASGTLEFEEQPVPGSAPAGLGLAPQIVLECNWVCASDGTLKVSPQTFVAGDKLCRHVVQYTLEPPY